MISLQHSPYTVAAALAKMRSSKLRTTNPRIAILSTLIKLDQPSGIEQVHAELNGKCDLVTVYRCMSAFEKIGLVRRSFDFNGTQLYMMAGTTTRYHIVSKDTKAVEELDATTSDEIRQVLLSVEEKLRSQGYTRVGHIAEFFGTPPSKSTRRG